MQKYDPCLPMTVILMPQGIKISTQRKIDNSGESQKTSSYRFLLLFLSIEAFSSKEEIRQNSLLLTKSLERLDFVPS